MSDDQKEIEQSGLFQCVLNWLLAFTFAQNSGSYVWMTDVITTLGVIGVFGDHAVTLRRLVRHRTPIELNPKRTEIDTFQLDRFRHNSDSSLANVNFDHREFLSESDEVPVDIPRRRARNAWLRRKLHRKRRQFGSRRIDGAGDLIIKLLGRRPPTARLSDGSHSYE